MFKSRPKSLTSVTTDGDRYGSQQRAQNHLLDLDQQQESITYSSSMSSKQKERRTTRASLLVPGKLFVVFVVTVALGLCLSFLTISHFSSATLKHRNLLDIPPPASSEQQQQQQQQQQTKQDSHVYDVVIVGAGWAGLAAGSKLYEQGIHNFVILEGRDTIGGRSRTTYPFGSSAPNLAVEIGSAWTYEGTEPHEMMLAQKQPYGQVHYDDPSTFGLYDAKNGEITGTERNHYQHLWKDYCDYSHRVAEHLEEKEQDMPYQVVLDSYITSRGKQHKKEKKLQSHEIQFLKSMVHAQIEIEYAATISDVSAQTVGGSVDERCVFCDADYYVPVEGGGFDKLLRPLAQPFQDKIRVNSKVTRVEYPNQDLAKVTYVDKHGTQKSKLAKTVIMTVPLGVLKRRTIDFVPPLPQVKLNAIESTGWGVLNKCILYWDQEQSDWWPKGKEVLTLANGENTFTTMFNDMELGNGGHYVLSAWIGGKTAMEMEHQPDQIIVAQVMDNLRAMMKNHHGPNDTDANVVPDPTQYVISRWGQDEFSYGSYSYHRSGREGLHSTARKELGARTGSSLFWAGEATHRKWPATTVGAYRSGQDVADDIMLALEHEHKNDYRDITAIREQ